MPLYKNDEHLISKCNFFSHEYVDQVGDTTYSDTTLYSTCGILGLFAKKATPVCETGGLFNSTSSLLDDCETDAGLNCSYVDDSHVCVQEMNGTKYEWSNIPASQRSMMCDIRKGPLDVGNVPLATLCGEKQ